MANPTHQPSARPHCRPHRLHPKKTTCICPTRPIRNKPRGQCPLEHPGRPRPHLQCGCLPTPPKTPNTTNTNTTTPKPLNTNQTITTTSKQIEYQPKWTPQRQEHQRIQILATPRPQRSLNANPRPQHLNKPRDKLDPKQVKQRTPEKSSKPRPKPAKVPRQPNPASLPYASFRVQSGKTN